MNKDFNLLSEAYQLILEKKTMCKWAKEGCDCDCGCKDCKKNQTDTVDEAKKLTPAQKKLAAAAEPYDKITRADIITLATNKKKKKNKLEEAYDQILEASATDKVVNKKLARDYYKAVKAMRKCEHGSKEYEGYKSQKEDILKIVNDHGKTVADLDGFLTKVEKEEAAGEGGEDNKVTAKVCTLCGGDHSADECPGEGNTPA